MGGRDSNEKQDKTSATRHVESFGEHSAVNYLDVVGQECAYLRIFDGCLMYKRQTAMTYRQNAKKRVSYTIKLVN